MSTFYAFRYNPNNDIRVTIHRPVRDEIGECACPMSEDVPICEDAFLEVFQDYVPNDPKKFLKVDVGDVIVSEHDIADEPEPEE